MHAVSEPRWTIVLPYYNEEGFIARTIEAAIGLIGPAIRLVLVDNASTDGTRALCDRLLARAPHLEVEHVFEAEPGPSHALKAGFDRVTTPYVAFWNADTWYPADYLLRAEKLLRQPKVVAAMAVDIGGSPWSVAGLVRRYQKRIASMVMRGQAHTGTFGQCFRTEVLRAAGGPRSERWPWVLDDHELMQRVLKLGESRYRADFWCMPSDRRGASAHVRWTLVERLIYHLTPFRMKDWFFYRFLWRRFQLRGMGTANLRIRDWAQS